MDNPLQKLFLSKIKNFNSNGSKNFSETLVDNKSFNFNINEYAHEWISIYKDEFKESSSKQFNELYNKNLKIDADDFLTMNYFYSWILVDFFNLLAFLPGNLKSILNIGAGIGYLDVILFQLYKKDIHQFFIEKKAYDEENSLVDGIRKLSKTINPLSLLDKNLKLNKINNYKIFSSENFTNELNDIPLPIDLILSLRSWCFLYDIDIYYNDLKEISNNDTYIITDVSLDRTEEFKSKFIPLKQIQTFKYYTRVLAKIRF